MGFFGKLKANFTHGGVKVQLQAPDSATANQAIPVTVSVTADSPQTINGVTVSLLAQAKEQGLSMNNGGVGVQAGSTTHQTIAQVQNSERFTLAPGETKSVSVQLYVNGANATAFGPAANAMGGFLQTAVNAVQNIEHINYLYSVHAKADVEGVTLDPSASKPIQIIPASAQTPTVTN